MQCFNETLRIETLRMSLFEASRGWYPIWNLLHIRTNGVSLGRKPACVTAEEHSPTNFKSLVFGRILAHAKHLPISTFAVFVFKRSLAFLMLRR